MLSRIAHLLLLLTSLAPAAITWAIADYGRNGFSTSQLYASAAAGILGLVCMGVLKAAEHQLGRVSIDAAELKPADSEAATFIFIYLLPLIAPAYGISLLLASPILVLFLAISSALTFALTFTFNPLLLLFGYRFYQVRTTSGIHYLLISKTEITDLNQVRHVGLMTRYLLLHIQ